MTARISAEVNDVCRVRVGSALRHDKHLWVGWAVDEGVVTDLDGPHAVMDLGHVFRDVLLADTRQTSLDQAEQDHLVPVLVNACVTAARALN